MKFHFYDPDEHCTGQCGKCTQNETTKVAGNDERIILCPERSEMKITVTAKPRSKKEYIQKVDETNFIVAVHAPPVDDKANRAIIESLAEYFQLPKSRFRIVSGHTAKKKIIEII